MYFVFQWTSWPMWHGSWVVSPVTASLALAPTWTLPVSATSWERSSIFTLPAATAGSLESTETLVVCNTDFRLPLYLLVYLWQIICIVLCSDEYLFVYTTCTQDNHYHMSVSHSACVERCECCWSFSADPQPTDGSWGWQWELEGCP